MPNQQVLPVTPGVLPPGFCPATYQDLLVGLSAAQSVTIPIGTNISVIVQSAKPSADESNGSFIWARLDDVGRFIGLYWFAQGAWLSPHPIAPGLTQWWFNTLPTFTTFDGGDANALSAISGPMWQQAKTPNGTVIAAQFPIAAGTLPAPPAGTGLVLNPGDTGGEQLHVLSAAEGGFNPTHTHVTGRWKTNTGGLDLTDKHFSLIGAANPAPSGQAREMAGVDWPRTIEDISAQGGDYTVTSPAIEPADFALTGHNTMPPYVVGYLLQRTARMFYAV